MAEAVAAGRDESSAATLETQGILERERMVKRRRKVKGYTVYSF